ncbi:MAG: hypothetical protein Q8L34_00820, partial [Candidatus Woesearchaeota archaeon]|nr:hypothetical protein [Candidatus Woesearchaeota archaeon]
MHQRIIQKLVEMEDLIVPTLFKPVQFTILKKLDTGKKLTDNEKRYLRGKMRVKLNILNSCMDGSVKMVNEYSIVLGSLESYYITG